MSPYYTHTLSTLYNNNIHDDDGDDDDDVVNDDDDDDNNYSIITAKSMDNHLVFK